MGKRNREPRNSGAKTLSKTLKSSEKVLQPKAQEKEKRTRIQMNLNTELSPKLTVMKTGGRTSRSGRLLKAAEPEMNSIPGDVSKFVTKHSPKRLKPKASLDSSLTEEKMEIPSPEVEVVIGKVDIPSHNKENLEDAMSQAAGKADASLDESMEQNESADTSKKSLKMTIEEIMDGGLKPETSETVDDEPKESEVEDEPEPSETVVDEPKESEDNEDLKNEDSHESAENHDEDMNETNGNHSDSVSDSDSALGSAASCNDPKDEEVTLGQVVWGSFNGTSWWPCIVYPIGESGTFISQNKTVKKIHVKYFNWSSHNNSGLLSLRNVFEFSTLEKFYEQIAARRIKKSKMKSFSKACLKAIEEAKFFRLQPSDQRLKLFDEYIMKTKTSRKSTDAGKSQNESRSTAERRSVDSALGASMSPAPSSPRSDNAADPLEFLFRSMNKFDEMPEKKPARIVTPKAIKIEPVEVTQEDNNRRRSGRAIKKRTYDDFQQDFEVDIKPIVPSSAVASPAVEQKSKKPKLEKEETLEERFVVKQQDMRGAIFRNMSKKRVCLECLEITDEITFRCSGKDSTKCAGWFHKSCAAHYEIVYEQIRHQTGDSDEIIQIPTMKSTLICRACFAGESKCFICKFQFGEEGAEGSCPYSDCRMAFHKSCLSHWPQAKSVSANRKATPCPQHTCHTCFSKDIHNTGALLKCVSCPSAYHVQTSCVPAGSQILSQSQMICPRHPTDKELVRNKKEMKPLNIDWCQLCPESGSLICCETCPAAFHPKCINYVESDDIYICQECKEGRLPLYNTIVWARVGAYRWWPGLIMPNNVLPEAIADTQRFPREFCIRFFGSYDFYWFTCERVFLYDGTNISVKGGSSKLDHAFNTALNEAHEMAKLLNAEDPQVMTAKPKPYVKIIQNRPVAPVKLKKFTESTQERCSCKPTDPDPCGRTSDCINLHLNVECSKGVCPAGDRCKNQKLRNREYAALKIVKTLHRGFGAICTEDIAEDTFVSEYVGELIDSAEFNKRMNAKIHNKEKDFYFLTVEGDLYVDAGPAGNLSRFINHSCEPNCITRKIQVEGNTRIGIFAKEFIKSGTELTFDYQMEFVDNKKTACFCGAAKCSGLIGEKPKEPEKKATAAVKPKRKRRKPLARPEIKSEPKALPAVKIETIATPAVKVEPMARPAVEVEPMEPPAVVVSNNSSVEEDEEESEAEVSQEMADVTQEAAENTQELSEVAPPSPAAVQDLTPRRASSKKPRDVDDTTDPFETTLEKMASNDFSHIHDDCSRDSESSELKNVSVTEENSKMEVDEVDPTVTSVDEENSKMEVDEVEPQTTTEVEPPLTTVDEAVADTESVPQAEELAEKPIAEPNEPENLEPFNAEPQSTPVEDKTAITDTPSTAATSD